MSSLVPSLQSTSTTSTSSSVPPLDLRVGTTFTIRGPSIYRDITPPEDYPLPAPLSSHPPRPLHQALVGPTGIAESGSAWEVQLVTLYDVNSESLMRMARGTQIELSGDLFVFAVESAAAQYNTYRALQGREIPLCYGLFRTTIGGTAVHVLLLESFAAGEVTSVASWEKAARSFFSVEDAEISLGDKNEAPALHTPSMFGIKMAGYHNFLSRFLECEPRYLPRLTGLGRTVLVSYTPDPILYLHYILTAPRSVKAVTEILKRAYTETSLASPEYVENSVTAWENWLVVMKVHSLLGYIGMDE